ncbi:MULTISPECIES: hypothetical protein [Streptomyces]|uniref:Integral membrane protein n=1 Tax=Streptomyces mirabilis TaxID=68239 RepID=A0ABU3UHQ2_9ACTN|nr:MULTISPECIES: hypothetical protein [Streptomyces]MCX4612853.1 hypothetical protein [Streptomyces mirabilis]MDU8993445.1 hypothetical protein [Streptomyces mirabilis]QDN91051.1 hypothetical protein FNV61_40715 [Streptomyces sp. RLB3-6]QDO11875.1 hypothetical protein FNV68_41785 [Streptomyces sp. S1D4-23]
MSSVVVVLLLLAGLSESAGRILPLVATRYSASRPIVAIGLLLTGAMVESAVIALWPRTASTLAELVVSAPSSHAALTWTPGLVAPLVLAAVLAFPLLGPLLHLLLIVGVGVGLVAPLSEMTDLGWWAAAGCVAVAGVGLAAAVEVIRNLLVKISASGAQELLT